MPSKTETVGAYLKALTPERKKALNAVRKVIKENLDANYKEGMQYGMVGYFVPHAVFPDGYHANPKEPLPFAGLASQKNHMAVYLMCLYNDPKEEAWFKKQWAKSGKKLDMGKSCIRFKKLEDLDLDTLGKAIARVPAKKYIAKYKATLNK